MSLLIIGALVIAIWFLVFWIQPLAALSVFERLTPNVIYRVRVELPLVALSFDDGPPPYLYSRVLDILQAHEAKATFFLKRALRYPELVERIKAAGHEVGNHYYKDGSTFAHSDARGRCFSWNLIVGPRWRRNLFVLGWFSRKGGHVALV